MGSDHPSRYLMGMKVSQNFKIVLSKYERSVKIPGTKFDFYAKSEKSTFDANIIIT